jgi:hypothetical protein
MLNSCGAASHQCDHQRIQCLETTCWSVVRRPSMPPAQEAHRLWYCCRLSIMLVISFRHAFVRGKGLVSALCVHMLVWHQWIELVCQMVWHCHSGNMTFSLIVLQEVLRRTTLNITTFELNWGRNIPTGSYFIMLIGLLVLGLRRVR